MYILVFIIILAILVLIHELGHFLAAKKNGIRVEEFGFGFPPRVWGFKKGETLYSINLLPIGGFVKLFGEEYHEVGSGSKKKVDQKLMKRAFINKTPAQKAFVIVAGVLGNFILAWILISYLFTQGVPTPTDKVLVEKTTKNSPAELVNLQPGDQLTRITVGAKMFQLRSTEDLTYYSRKFAGKRVIFTIKSQGKEKNLMIIPRLSPPAGEGPLGLLITSYEDKKYSWYQAPFYGLIHSFTITKTIVIELGKTAFNFFTMKKAQVDVAGPIGIAQYTGQAIKFGQNAVLELMALLSLNLAVINILPFPALDGGRLMFILYEWVTKRRINKNVERYVNMVGMGTLLFLAAAITIHDIIKLIK